MNPYIEKADSALMHTYNRFPVVLEKGEGVYLYDTDGKKYLDFGAGIAVFALGYGNQAFNSAVKAQVDKLIHTSNLYYSVPMAEAAVLVQKATGMDQVFFTNSGTEAIEGAIKLARKYAWKKNPEAGHEIISMGHSFHGRSMGALTVTGQPKYQEAFKPLIGGVVYAQFNNLDSVKALVNENTCAIILEPVQGEGGIYPAEKEFLQGVRALCDDKDIVLIFDEIQCGMGRTGTMYAYEQYGVKPDILATAKALGCGVPVGAFAAVKKVGDAFEPGDHGTTYGGNPLAAAAACAVFDQFDKLHVLDNVNRVAPYLEEKLDELVKNYSDIKERRGKGLMQGLEFTHPVGDIVKKALEAGLIVMSAGPNVIRFVPPLIITEADVDTMIGILKRVMKNEE
ncbi:aspartate aminotransferase family protein [Anaerolentibacter hominis]|uniref:aspartate aminotransferase family protein n=1 Tax=Anaerolentibacter hominis TaxID=3079009 RepID=UPI0031B89212